MKAQRDGNSSQKRHRSFVPSDFSLRDIPAFLLLYAILSIVCVVAGVVIQSWGDFWQGFAFGIAVGMSATVGLWLLLSKISKR